MALATEELAKAREELDSLDGAIGDGDHGSSLARSFVAARESLASDPSIPAMKDAGAVLARFGERLLEHGVGASGPLYGVFFLTLGRSLPPSGSASLVELAAAAGTAFRAVSDLSGSGLGSATLLDALWPFSESLMASSNLHLPMEEALSRAADAAAEGAARTAAMVPGAGRARSYGSAALGHPDPGAQSMALVARAVAHAVVAHAQ